MDHELFSTGDSLLIPAFKLSPMRWLKQGLQAMYVRPSLGETQAPSPFTNPFPSRGQLSFTFLFIQFQHTYFGGGGRCQKFAYYC